MWDFTHQNDQKLSKTFDETVKILKILFSWIFRAGDKNYVQTIFKISLFCLQKTTSSVASFVISSSNEDSDFLHNKKLRNAKSI